MRALRPQPHPLRSPQPRRRANAPASFALAVAGLALGLAGLPACGSRVAGLYTDPSFTRESLRAKAVVPLGVVFLQGDDDRDERLRFAESVRHTLSERRADLAVAPAGEALIAIGPDEVDLLLDQYRRTGRFTAAQLEDLARAQPVARYLVLGRVDTDLVERTREESRTRDGDRVRLEIEMITRREMGITFDVYDLERRDLVWSAYFQRTETERGERLDFEESEENLGAFEADIDQAIRDMVAAARHPEPPSRAQLLRSFTRDLARGLPGGD
jgi:hypothetical protein